MIGYKVTWEHSGIGIVSNQTSGLALVEYKKDKFVQAPRWLAEKGYHCCVFLSLDDALTFCNQQGGIVWAARLHGVCNPNPMLRVRSLSKGRLDPFHHVSWPKGTYFARDVKLLARVKQ